MHQESQPNLAHNFVKSGEESKKNLVNRASNSDLTSLKTKIKEMKHKHQSDILNQSSSEQKIGSGGSETNDDRGRPMF